MRIWFKLIKDNRLLNDLMVINHEEDTRTHKIFQALEECCSQMDLSKPLWLDSAIKEFKRHSKVRFYQDHFMEQIDFDYLELHVIEED